MKQRRPEEIIGEWGVRDVTPPSQVERTRLAADHEINPLVGQILPRRIRRFRVEADTYLAALGGPLPYMRRLRQIDDEMTHLSHDDMIIAALKRKKLEIKDELRRLQGQAA